jgi:hypothetical protein
MLYKKPTQWQKLRDHRIIGGVASFLAGIHAAHGIAHGVPVSERSAARHQVQTVGSTGG